ncbi:putative folate-biopterin transporter 9, chloroplastic [Cinnamomum micranthum f. kanehirae]|uniref:Putative folate-biopterin transporter 9, chloroplastic n=1 Tax=Cinnamomum micranthum f. kanehirae TaxID=337451 RepID=A0A443PZ49_9MAGN|nr:putative folate-biopterin transporter 9, chloroplastic [Cinnamomum micranthum f. kanehirae]
MISVTVTTPKPKNLFIPITPTTRSPPSLLFTSIHNPPHNQKISYPNSRKSIIPNTHILKPLLNQTQPPKSLYTLPVRTNVQDNYGCHLLHVGDRQVLGLCGLGYWVQGLRCFPWLALNFHMAQGLNLHPSTLQLVQYSANLPMVAKPLYGILSDTFDIGGAQRIPYITFGVLLQVLSWSTLALIPVAGGTLSTQMACVLLSNLGASFAEVASDALITERSKKYKAGELQSYAFMALAAGGILGNFSGGFFLKRTQQPKVLFLIFSLLLSFQLAISLTTKENLLVSPRCSNHHLVQKSVSENLSKQFSDLITAVTEESILRPLSWVVASVAVVPMLSGTTFCYQTQSLKLDPSIIGISKVIGQLLVLSATIVYNSCLKRIPMRKLIYWLQIMYAVSMLSDFFLVKQINVRLGISNEIYVLCVSALTEAVAQFKILPFSVLFANLCPPGCEGSLVAFLASALCLSSIFSGFSGVVLAYLIGISTDDYSSLPLGIILQVVAALLPLGWISQIPISQTAGKRRRRSKRRRAALLPASSSEG